MKKITFTPNNIVKVGDISINQISTGAKNVLETFGKIYEDKILTEDLLSVAHVKDHSDWKFFSLKIRRELNAIQKEMDKKNVSYIRILSI